MTDVETTTEACPGWETMHCNLNADADAWYCETPDCSVVLFGPRGEGKWVENERHYGKLDSDEYGDNAE